MPESIEGRQQAPEESYWDILSPKKEEEIIRFVREGKFDEALATTEKLNPSSRDLMFHRIVSECARRLNWGNAKLAAGMIEDPDERKLLLGWIKRQKEGGSTIERFGRRGK